MNDYRIFQGDVIDMLKTLPSGSVQCVVTSPPYWGLRDYGNDGQLGLEPTPDCLGWATREPCGMCYVCHMVAVFQELRRVLRDDGTCWLNLGDSYASSKTGNTNGGESSGLKSGGRSEESRRRSNAKLASQMSSMSFRKLTPPGFKSKDLVGIPWRVALALQADGWWLRSEIVWHKRAPMPESVTDRPTKAHEQVFLLTKAARYYYDADAVREPGVEYKGSADTFKRNNSKRGVPMIGQSHGTHRPDRDDRVPAGSNMRSVWTLSPGGFPEAHFATFPTEIPRRAVLAGTSERGCCPSCGKPWVRVVERESSIPPRADGFYNSEPRFLGWRAGCECNAGEPIPCVVLDPFLGSGTTIAVSVGLGRIGWGIELNPDYVEMAHRRIGTVQRPLLMAVNYLPKPSFL